MCKNTLVLFRHGVLQVGVCGARIRESGVEVKFERVRAVVSAGMKWRKWVVGTEQEDIARLENVRCNEASPQAVLQPIIIRTLYKQEQATGSITAF